MYLVVIGWLYVAVMMSVAEATNTNGTFLGAIVTFFLYGFVPVALVIYLMGRPARRRQRARALAQSDHAPAPAPDDATQISSHEESSS